MKDFSGPPYPVPEISILIAEITQKEIKK